MLYSLSASVAAGRQMEEAIVEAEENLSVMYGEKEPIMKELKYMKINITENKESDKLLLKDFACRSKIEDIEDFVQVYITCRNMGGDLEKIIGHTTEILTDKMSIEREIRAITSQKKTEGKRWLFSVLLFFLPLFIFLIYTKAPFILLYRGRPIMSGGLAAMVFGIYLMEKISDIEI